MMGKEKDRVIAEFRRLFEECFMSTQIIVSNLPHCDFCEKIAHYDIKTRSGFWANACEDHFKTHSRKKKLGTGFGQRLILEGK